MILGQAKNPHAARLGEWGRARITALAIPHPEPERRRAACGVFVCHRTRGPLSAEWTIPRAYARVEGGGPGEGLVGNAHLHR